MNISPELIAIAILGVSLVSLGWKVSSDIRQELKQPRMEGPPPTCEQDVETRNSLRPRRRGRPQGTNGSAGRVV